MASGEAYLGSLVSELPGRVSSSAVIISSIFSILFVPSSIGIIDGQYRRDRQTEFHITRDSWLNQVRTYCSMFHTNATVADGNRASCGTISTERDWRLNDSRLGSQPASQRNFKIWKWERVCVCVVSLAWPSRVRPSHPVTNSKKTWESDDCSHGNRETRITTVSSLVWSDMFLCFQKRFWSFHSCMKNPSRKEKGTTKKQTNHCLSWFPSRKH